MAWTFPETLFDMLLDGSREHLNCVWIGSDSEHVTVDRDWVLGVGQVMRLRTQVRLEDIRAIHEIVQLLDRQDRLTPTRPLRA